MTLRLVEAGKKFLQSRVVEEADEAYAARVKDERGRVIASLNAANQVVAGEIAANGLTKDVFEWSRERTYQADADISRSIPRKRWIKVIGNIKLGIPSARSN